jgi:hypothetical protein
MINDLLTAIMDLEQILKYDSNNERKAEARELWEMIMRGH